MYCDDEKYRLVMREMASYGIWQHRSASRERGQFWWEITPNRNDQDFP